MTNLKKFADKPKLAEAVAKESVKVLNVAITEYGSAVWVVSGGSTPLAAYLIIADQFKDDVEWSKVTVIIGDERMGPADSPDNNWNEIDKIIGNLPTQKMRPLTDVSAEHAAEDYERQLASLSKVGTGLPRLDLVWLGVGEDGHTLSLFPNHESLAPSNNLVVPIHDSPKPPPDRISLSLRALIGTQNAFILAAGADKKNAVTKAQSLSSLPIGLAISIMTTHESKVTWFVDKDATPTD